MHPVALIGRLARPGGTSSPSVTLVRVSRLQAGLRGASARYRSKNSNSRSGRTKRRIKITNTSCALAKLGNAHHRGFTAFAIHKDKIHRVTTNTLPLPRQRLGN